MSTEEESNSVMNTLKELIRPIVGVVTTLRLFLVDDADNNAVATPSNFYLFELWHDLTS